MMELRDQLIEHESVRVSSQPLPACVPCYRMSMRSCLRAQVLPIYYLLNVPTESSQCSSCAFDRAFRVGRDWRLHPRTIPVQ